MSVLVSLLGLAGFDSTPVASGLKVARVFLLELLLAFSIRSNESAKAARLLRALEVLTQQLDEFRVEEGFPCSIPRAEGERDRREKAQQPHDQRCDTPRAS